jgi:hypothetical protein
MMKIAVGRHPRIAGMTLLDRTLIAAGLLLAALLVGLQLVRVITVIPPWMSLAP